MGIEPTSHALQAIEIYWLPCPCPRLCEFLAYAQIPLGAEQCKHLPDFVFSFWVGVAMVYVLALWLVVSRHFEHVERANATI
jgi:hypothetical protein